MLKTLPAHALTVDIDPASLGFATTAEITQPAPLWIGQAEAKSAAEFGLAMPHPHFNLLVLGESGSGRTSLLYAMLQSFAAKQKPAHDLVYVANFKSVEKPQLIKLKAGGGELLRERAEQMMRALNKALQPMVNPPENAMALTQAEQQDWLKAFEQEVNVKLAETFDTLTDYVLEDADLTNYLSQLAQDIIKGVRLLQTHIEQAGSADSEGFLEGVLARYRVNVLVSHAGETSAPVIYDDDPTFSSLFGGIDSASEQHQGAEFMRLRAGNLLRADGGFLLLHLRDLYSDESSGSQILEKLHRFLRNGRVRLEDVSSASAGGSSAAIVNAEPIALNTKLVLIATPEEYYELHDEFPEFGSYFRVKVDFSDRAQATPALYHAIAQYIAQLCNTYALPHFTAPAVSRLLQMMHRRIDDQKRVSTQFSELQDLVLESLAFSAQKKSKVTDLQEVEAALAARYLRLSMPERMMRESIIDGELMIRVHGKAVGQINGLTHIELGDACFGSPVRISARCHAGEDGIINIDREVEMTGPNHDKGLFILQNWLSASFPKLTPLSLNASIVFEQEYHGVEGDSASCAELYALLSAISGMALPQGIAITGAMNQHGEVMAVGGVNEKIEGFFRLCKQMGLDGTQGVLIPERNCAHLVLEGDVLEAVNQGLFHVYPIRHVLEGVEHLIGIGAGALDEEGDYAEASFMGQVQQVLEGLRKTFDHNKSDAKEDA